MPALRPYLRTLTVALASALGSSRRFCANASGHYCGTPPNPILRVTIGSIDGRTRRYGAKEKGQDI